MNIKLRVIFEILTTLLLGLVVIYTVFSLLTSFSPMTILIALAAASSCSIIYFFYLIRVDYLTTLANLNKKHNQLDTDQ